MCAFQITEEIENDKEQRKKKGNLRTETVK